MTFIKLTLRCGEKPIFIAKSSIKILEPIEGGTQIFADCTYNPTVTETVEEIMSEINSGGKQ